MSNDKMGATGWTGPLPQRTPMETLAAHGAPPEPPIGHSTERPYVSPGTPPWGSLASDIGHEPRLTGREVWASANPAAKIRLMVIGVAVIISLTLGLVIVQRANLLPAGVPVIGKDSGLAACEAIQHGSAPVGGKTTVSPGDFQKARAAFAGSRYEAIRTNGVKLMDLAVQISALGTDPGIGALAYIQAFTDAYAGLAGGCAAVGHPIPALNAN